MKNIAVHNVTDPVPSLPLKVALITDLGGALKRHVKEKHSKEIATQHEDSFTKIQTARENMVQTTHTYSTYHTYHGDKCYSANPITESSIVTNMYVYAVYLQFANHHFPLSDGKISNLRYVWRDAFQAGGASWGSTNSFTDLASVLFNAAAMWSVMASRDPNPKNAFQLYQQAAGVIEAISLKLAPNYLNSSATGENAPPFDIRKEGLDMAMAFLLAAANHCGYMKAIGGKNSLLSKLAVEVAAAYRAVAKTMQAQGVGTVSPQWGNTMQYWEEVFMARAHWHLAMDTGAEEKDIGLCIARMRIVHSRLDAASRLDVVPGHLQKGHIQDLLGHCGAQLSELERMNNTVYTERVPKEVPEPTGTGGKTLAKATTLPSLLSITKISGDPFANIKPLHISDQANAYKEQLTEKVKSHMKSLQGQREKIRSNLQSLGAMGLIEQLDAASRKEECIPETLAQRIRIVHAEGGENALKSLVDSIGSLRSLAELCKGVIDQSVNAIAACPILPSLHGQQDTELEQLYHQSTELQTELADLLQRITAQESKIKRNEEALMKVSWSLKDITVLMPSKGTDLGQNGESEALQKLLGKLRADVASIAAQEDEENKGLNEMQGMLQNEDIISKLAALPQERHQSVLEQMVKKYGDNLTALNDNSQRSVLTNNSMVRTVTEIRQLMSSNVVSCQRAAWVNELDSACGIFFDIRGALREAATAATTYSARTESMKETVDSLVAVRRMEAEEVERVAREAEQQRRAEVERRDKLEKDQAASKARQEELKAQIAKATAEMEAAAAARKLMVEKGLQQQHEMMRRMQAQQAMTSNMTQGGQPLIFQQPMGGPQVSFAVPPAYTQGPPPPQYSEI